IVHIVRYCQNSRNSTNGGGNESHGDIAILAACEWRDTVVRLGIGSSHGDACDVQGHGLVVEQIKPIRGTCPDGNPVKIVRGHRCRCCTYPIPGKVQYLWTVSCTICN